MWGRGRGEGCWGRWYDGGKVRGVGGGSVGGGMRAEVDELRESERRRVRVRCGKACLLPPAYCLLLGVCCLIDSL